jgi:hypothetical protein
MTETAGPASAPAWSVARRLIAALAMGLLLLALSAVIHTAAAASFGVGWPYLWATEMGAAIVALGVALSAPSTLHAWRRLCLINAAAAGIAAVLIGSLSASPPVQGTTGAPDTSPWLGAPHPMGAAFGAALFSGLLGIAAATLAIVLLVIFYLLRRRGRPSSPASRHRRV